jgi:Protein of unknown function (DUF1200).
MNRIFHARIAWYQYFLLAVLTVNAVGALWCKYILPAALFMLMLIVIIEQIIHTAYILTADGNLEISRGRFIRRKLVPVSGITAVRKCCSMKFGNFSVTDYILIEYGEGKFASVMPVKEREFVELLEKKMSEKRLSGKRMSEKRMEGAGAAGSQEEEPPVLDE